MGDSKPANSANFGARFLIMIYALGIVFIGMRPIQKEYGSVWKFLKIKSSKMDIKNPFAGTWDELLKSDKAKSSSSSKPEASLAREKSVESVSAEDRGGLKQFLEKLD